MTREIYQNHTSVRWTHTVEDREKSEGSVRNHYDRQLILTYFVNGSGKLLAEGNEHLFSSGDLLICSPNELHFCRIDACKHHERISFYVDLPFAEEVHRDSKTLFAAYFDRAPGEGNIVSRRTAERLGIGALLCETVRMKDGMSEEAYREYVTFRTAELLLLLREAVKVPEPHAKPTENRQIRAILQYINSHLGEEITTASVAEAFFLDKSYLCRRFKQCTGVTLCRYVTKKRADAAAALMEAGKSCTEACFESGFGNYSSFYKAFRTCCGRTPTARGKK